MRRRRARCSTWLACALGVTPVMSAEPIAASFFTAEQSSTGQQLYDQKCGGCHAPDLGEGSHGPALRGDHFWATWGDKSARELYGRILSTMPSGDPGSLSQRQVLALM